MSAGMAGIITAHSGHSVKLSPQGMFTVHCHGCGRSTPAHGEGKLPRSGAPIHAAHVAEELTKAGYGNVQAKGYLIVDKVTGALDWDGELHATVEAAVESMCGPHQSFSRDPEDFIGDDTTYWADVYAIHPVSAPLEPTLIAALADPEGHALVKAIHDRKAEG